MSPMPAPLARAHAWARAQPWLGRFTLMNRILLAMAFLPTGAVKATGQRFTTLPVEDPIGFFFEAMYRTGPFWNFVGAVQVLSAVLLLVPVRPVHEEELLRLVSEKRDPGLLEWTAGNIFQARVYPIPANGSTSSSTPESRKPRSQAS